MLEGLTAWHEKNPLLDAFCEGMDDPDPRGAFERKGFAPGTDTPSGDENAASFADPEAQALRWY